MSLERSMALVGRKRRGGGTSRKHVLGREHGSGREKEGGGYQKACPRKGA